MVFFKINKLCIILYRNFVALKNKTMAKKTEEVNDSKKVNVEKLKALQLTLDKLEKTYGKLCRIKCKN